MNQDPRGGMYEENRPWGSFRRFTLNTPSTVKLITVEPNQSLSLQKHRHRSEFWRIVGGSGIVEIDGVQHTASKGEEFFIPQGSTHRAKTEHEVLEIMEIAMGEFDENDIERLEDKYGRLA